ncbi:MAG: hypothetical protein MK193_02180 [Lentisphaeria bacterium]|nr:hypothetical protein [Lentisphaeria bacterium]
MQEGTKKNWVDLTQMNQVMRHRLRNLSCGLTMAIERIQEEVGEDYVQVNSMAQLMTAELENLEEMTFRMDLLFDDLPEKTSLSLFELVIKARQKLLDLYPHVDLKVSGKELKLSIHGANLLLIAIHEILVNYAEEKETDLQLYWELENEQLALSISGPSKGIPESIPLEPPQPFFTEKGKHDGLGFAIAHRILKSSGGILLTRFENGILFFKLVYGEVKVDV